MSGFTAIGYFLFSILFGIAIFSLWLRIATRFFKISSLNPFSRLIYSVTDPIIKPISSLFNYQYKPGEKYDWIAFGVLILVEFLKIIIYSLLLFHTIIPFIYVLMYVAADLIIQPCNILFYAILIRVIMSYINPNWQHPIADFLRPITQPLLILGRKIIPDISGFDFSPFIIIIILIVIRMFVKALLPWNII